MITVIAPPGVELDDICESEVFKSWERKAEKHGDATVDIHKVYQWGGEIRMIQMAVRQGGVQYATTLRGQTVDMLTILTSSQNRYVIIAEQYRQPAAQDVRSNPSGMVDTGEEPKVAGLREVGEELGVTLEWQVAVNLNEQLLDSPAPLLVSPGTSDEAVTFFVLEARTSPEQLEKLVEELASRPGGLAAEDEEIRLLPVDADCDPLIQLHEDFRPENGLLDLKAMTSLMMYDTYQQYFLPRA